MICAKKNFKYLEQVRIVVKLPKYYKAWTMTIRGVNKLNSSKPILFEFGSNSNPTKDEQVNIKPNPSSLRTT